MKRFLIFLNCKAVDDRQTESAARRCAEKWSEKYPTEKDNVVEIYDTETGEYIY